MKRRRSDWLRARSAGLRLRWAFGALLGMLMLLAVLAVQRLHAHQQALREIAESSQQRLRLTAEIGNGVARASRELLTLVSAERALRVEAYRRIDQAHQAVDLAVAALRVQQPGEGRRLGALQTALATYRGAYDETVDRIEAADAEGLRTLMATRTQPALERLSELVEQQLQREQDQLQGRIDAQRSRVRRDSLLIALLCLLGLGSAAVLTRAVRRSISVPLRRTEEVARRLAEGDYSARARVRGADEVAGLAEALNGLAEAVGAREQRIRQLANTDALTGLAQRERFLGEVALSLFGRSDQVQLLCVLDLERLKTINGLAGFDAGDAALRALADRLRELQPPPLALARLGGGSFALLLPEAGNAEAAARQLLTALERPFAWAGQSLDLHLSLGSARYPAHAQDAETLLRRAEQAMFEAKRLRSSPQGYSERLERARQQDLSLAGELLRAEQRGELLAHLQPKLRFGAGGALERVGAEALIRWQHPERGLVPPADFIPFAERSGRIRGLTRWMLGEAVGLLALPAFRGLGLAVNLSTHDLQDGELDQTLRALLERHAVEPARLTLEITESGLMEPGDDPVMLLQRLRSVGVRLAIDDFGTGHSSLAYLQRLPVDELKIDRSFVRDADLEPRRMALLRTIVQLGHDLGLAVTAEGVEREGELEAVREAGCDMVQGWRTGRPQALADFLLHKAG